MKQIISYLKAIRNTAKGIHYRAMGSDFWGNHLLADRIVDGLDDFEDEIFENYYLGKGEEAPQQKEIATEVAGIIPLIDDDIEAAFKALDNLILSCLTELQMIEAGDDSLTLGDKDLMGRISSDLQKKHGFILRRIK